MAGSLHSSGRRILSRRYKGRFERTEDNVSLDYRKDPDENLREILTNIVQRDGISKHKKLGYFNAFVRLSHRLGGNLGTQFTTEKVLSCLRLGLFHEAKEIRAACLRALRYVMLDGKAVDILLSLHIHYLIARSLDICQDNDIERIHSLRLMRKMMQVAPDKFSSTLLNVMISIANDGPQERDKTVKTCLATICELAFSNPKLLSESGGISSILQAVLQCHQLPRINESLIATILYLLNHPRTRHYIKEDVDLERVLAPFTDCHILIDGETNDQLGESKKEAQFIASKMAISTIMKSWPGLMRLCKPKGSGIQSLVGVLSLPNMDTRKEVMDVLFDVFRLPLPKWTNDFSEALLSIDPCSMRDSWRLIEGFVAEEGKAILPHLAKTRPNLVDNHMALVLSAFFTDGLLEALVEVITRSERHLAVRATILLGELLFMANNILPSELGLHSHCLPSLLAMASAYHIPDQVRDQAKHAVTWLNRHHVMKKRGPVPCTLYLDLIMQRSSQLTENSRQPQRVHKEKLLQCLGKDSEQEFVGVAIRDSQVLLTKASYNWDWDLISAILQWPDGDLRRLDDQTNQKFLRRLLNFFKPSNNLYSKVETSQENSSNMTTTFLNYVDFLVDCEEAEAQKCVDELLRDIAASMSHVKGKNMPSDSIYTATHLMRTLSQDYFLIIGRFSNTLKGEKLLESTGVYQNLLEIVTETTQDVFIKLIVSALDYSRDGQSRIILSKALTATSNSARLYTTSLIRVLLRAKVPFLSNWGMEMLVMQLYDQAKPVAMEALSVISEACEDEVNILTLINMRPAVLHLGYKGAILHARFLSMPVGFKGAMESNYVENELDKWHKVYNVKYVSVVEERLNEALTTYEKTYDGSYTRRSASAKRESRKDVFVPIHLYGQLVQHKHGFQLLEKQAYLSSFFHCVRHQSLETDQQVIHLKAALWALGHIGTSVWGLGLLEEETIIPEIIKLAEECGVFSVRGTAFYVLGLIASTEKGAGMLGHYGWEAVKRAHNELWPVILDELHTPPLETDRLSSHSSASVFESAKSQSVFSSVDLITSGVNCTDPHELPASTAVNQKDETGSVSGSSDHGDGKSRSSTTGSLGIEFSTQLVIPEAVNHTSENRPDEAATSPTDSSPKPPPRRRSRISSDMSNSESFQTPPSTAHRLSESSVTVIDIDNLPHERSQSDPTYSAANCVDEQQNKDAQTTVQFKIGSRESESDFLREPVIRNRSNSADAARDYLSSLGKQHGGSHESSRTSKSHSDSIRTDTSNTTTSGIGSCDSAGVGTTLPEHVPLSPIPSASSMATDKSQLGMTPDSGTLKHSVHPTDAVRNRANLRSIPSLKRGLSNPSVTPSLVPASTIMTSSLCENTVYTSSRDAHGYSVLRDLKRNRSMVGNVEAELMDFWGQESNIPKTRSLLDFRLGRPKNGLKPHLAHFPALKIGQTLLSCGTCSRNLSVTSLHELNEPMTPPATPGGTLNSSVSRDQVKRTAGKSGSSGRAQYIGLCLPVDVTMVFQVDAEDPRCLPPQLSVSEEMEDAIFEAGEVQKSQISLETDTGLEFHSSATCLACGCGSSQGNQVLLDKESIAERGPSPVMLLTVHTPHRGLKSYNSSMTDLPESVTSATSVESGSTKEKTVMSEDSPAGRILIRKEVIRLIVNLSSCVGIANAEQGLLILKQKFGSSFQDLCLYSEVSYLLGNYNYRLAARKFIQELFQDLDYSVLRKEAYVILGLDDTVVQENSDNFSHNLNNGVESIA